MYYDNSVEDSILSYQLSVNTVYRILSQFWGRHLFSQEPSAWCLPIPMVAVLSSGRKTPGKLFIIKDVMIFAKQDIAVEQVL